MLFIIQRKSPVHEVAVQGLKSYAMTVRGSILLLNETNEIVEVKDFRGLTFKIVSITHNTV